MSFPVNVYVVIRPKPLLIEKLTAYQTQVAEELRSSSLWQHRSDTRTARMVESITAFVKMLFIHRIKMLWHDDPEFQATVGQDPVVLDTFDKWWDAEYLGMPSEVTEDAILLLAEQGVTDYPPAGEEYADSWLKFHVRQALEKLNSQQQDG